MSNTGTFVGSALNDVACIAAGHLGIAKRECVGTRLTGREVGGGGWATENKLSAKLKICHK